MQYVIVTDDLKAHKEHFKHEGKLPKRVSGISEWLVEQRWNKPESIYSSYEPNPASVLGFGSTWRARSEGNVCMLILGVVYINFLFIIYVKIQFRNKSLRFR